MPKFFLSTKEIKSSVYLKALSQLKNSFDKSLWSIIEINLSLVAKDYFVEKHHTTDKILFLHTSIAEIQKNELVLTGSNITIKTLVDLFLFNTKLKPTYTYTNKYPPAIIFLLVKEITLEVSETITKSLGIDGFGRSRRKVYVIAIPVDKNLLATQQLNDDLIERIIADIINRLTSLLQDETTIGKLLKSFKGAQHFAQQNQFDSAEDDAAELKESLREALDLKIGFPLRTKKRNFSDYNIGAVSIEKDLQENKNLRPPAPFIPIYKDPPRSMAKRFLDFVKNSTSKNKSKKMPIVIGAPPQKIEPVNCTVYAPQSVIVGNQFLVQVYAHTTAQKKLLEKLATSADDTAIFRVTSTLQEDITIGSKLAFNLIIPDLIIDEPVLSIKWNGKLSTVQFGVTVPFNFSPTNIIGTVIVVFNSVPIGNLKFKLQILAKDASININKENTSSNEMILFKQAFISYSSVDRPEVLKRVQMLNLVKLKFFQDLLTLEAGDEWEKEIYHNIDTCDVFFLFWSTAASKSPWVSKEVEYAAARKKMNKEAPPEIVPVIIEGPPPAIPPEALNFLHFNDKFIYFINANTKPIANP